MDKTGMGVFGGGNLIIGKNQDDICSIRDCKILPGERKFAFLDDMATYQIALPQTDSVNALVEKYPQVAGIYTENYGGSFMTWQIIAYRTHDFRINRRHFDNGGITLMTDDCEAIIYVERHHRGVDKAYCWTKKVGVVRIIGRSDTEGVYVNVDKFYLPGNLEDLFIESL